MPVTLNNILSTDETSVFDWTHSDGRVTEFRINREYARSAADAIMHCMTWEDSPQGYAYWSYVHAVLLCAANGMDDYPQEIPIIESARRLPVDCFADDGRRLRDAAAQMDYAMSWAHSPEGHDFWTQCKRRLMVLSALRRGDRSEADYYRQRAGIDARSIPELEYLFTGFTSSTRRLPNRVTVADDEGDTRPPHADASKPIYGYHETTPIATHGWPAVTPKGALCFGVELEMEATESAGRETCDDCHGDGVIGLFSDDDSDDGETCPTCDGNRYVYRGQSSLCTALGNCYGATKPKGVNGKYILSNDGSLDDTGVELVTCPYTLDYHQKGFGWDKLLAAVAPIAHSGAGTTSCGMHVHVNRAAIGPLTLGKMLVFVNEPANRAFIEAIAQRDTSRWAKLYKKKLTDGLATDSERYQALHVAPKTIEFRIFRGNLRLERVLKNIEFCHAVTTWCQTISLRDAADQNKFMEWLRKHRSTYPNLVKFLADAAFERRFGKIPHAKIQDL